jgi:hypothetical protein
MLFVKVLNGTFTFSCTRRQHEAVVVVAGWRVVRFCSSECYFVPYKLIQRFTFFILKIFHRFCCCFFKFVHLVFRLPNHFFFKKKKGGETKTREGIEMHGTSKIRVLYSCLFFFPVLFVCVSCSRATAHAPKKTLVTPGLLLRISSGE